MKKRHFGMVLAGMVAVIGLAGGLYGAVSVPHIFGDHMVVQRQKPVVVWGWAEPGEQVRVQLGDHVQAGQADGEGKWKVVLGAMEANSTPMTMTITGTNVISIEDVLVGEVWLCSGQSNMEWTLGGGVAAAEKMAKADFPGIRLFKINSAPSAYTVGDVEDTWRVCRPDNVGDFSETGYFFGKDLHEELKIPIGLVEAAWGGTQIEVWTPREGFEGQEALADFVARLDQAEESYREELSAKLKELAAWIKRTEQALEKNERIPTQPKWPSHPIYSQGHPTGATCLYNSRIFPIVPFGLRGAIWYQGESNMGDGMFYYEKMKALIYGWRKVWGDPLLSFYYVQLAPFGHYSPDDLPKLWEAQSASLKIPHTGMAVINDIGNVEDIHPQNKRDVGKRLALWALAKNYGYEDLVFSGPIYKALKIMDDKIVISFDYVGEGLTTRDGKEPDWFEIAGADRVFHRANTKIVGDAVAVHCDQVTAPVAVRFAWDNRAEPNLANKNGLPASAFRTDNW